MSLSLTLTKDEITPDLRRLGSAALQQEIVTAGATLVAALGQRAFTEEGLRPSPWAPRKSKRLTHPLLILSGDLRQAIHAAGDQVRVPQRYAATHQLGSSKLGIPARPYLPIDESGQLTQIARAQMDELVAALIEP